jgi:hypothetical protein
LDFLRGQDQSIFEGTAFGRALLSIYRAYRHKDLTAVSRLIRRFWNGTRNNDRESLMRGDGFFNPDSGENALCALLPYVELVFNTLHKDQGIRFIGNDSHTTMSFSGVHICPSCTREMNWRRDLRSFFPLHGSQCVSISIAARMKAARVVCSQKECLHIAEKELVPVTFPTFFFVELSRDERSAEPGIPDSFILELSVLIREVRYELLSVVYRIPGRTAHFNCDAFREFNSENTWFKVDDL